jgi:hypothetical protein
MEFNFGISPQSPSTKYMSMKTIRANEVLASLTMLYQLHILCNIKSDETHIKYSIKVGEAFTTCFKVYLGIFLEGMSTMKTFVSQLECKSNTLLLSKPAWKTTRDRCNTI